MEAYEFLSKALSEGCENGRYELSGGAYANVSTYKTAPKEEKAFEAHRKYIDIQMIIRGNEIFVATDDTVIKPYDRVAVFALPQVLAKVNKFFI